jgi:hypothetical protein
MPDRPHDCDTIFRVRSRRQCRNIGGALITTSPCFVFSLGLKAESPYNCARFFVPQKSSFVRCDRLSAQPVAD